MKNEWINEVERLKRVNGELLEACKAAMHQLWLRRKTFSDQDHGAMNLLSAAITNAAENLELLDACRGLLDMITDNRLHGAEVYRASDAIKKATPEPQDPPAVVLGCGTGSERF